MSALLAGRAREETSPEQQVIRDTPHLLWTRRQYP